MNLKNALFYSAISLGVIFVSCSDDDNNNTNQNINQWIYANMEFWYYWTDELPSVPSTRLEPDDFYEALLFSGDRFSFIYDDYQELVDLLNGVSLESGFEFKLYASDGDEVIMQIIYIKKDSPAQDQGLLRGDLIDEINGVQLTESNYRDLLNQMQAPYSATFRRYNDETETFEGQGSVNINPVVFSENPVLLDSVYEIGGKKIGYLVYTFFSPGSTELGDEYDLLVDEIFGKFQTKSIDNFILDLRFNSGGAVSSAINLASLIVDGAEPGDAMVKREYNDVVQAEIIADPQLGIDFLTDEFLPKEENIGEQLENNRVYIITSASTASASELVINALRPFMDVYTVGETTTGKDVGSITIADEENPKNNWALQPIVVKLINSDDEDYPNGFSPNLNIEDNKLVLEPLGKIDEPLLNGALNSIGVVTTRRFTERKSFDTPSILNSRDRKVFGGKAIIDIPPLQ
jgi:C-terminal processing protease CtpA/Prc